MVQINLSMSKRVYIQTFGCQMNVYDSERIYQLLALRDYRLVEEPSQADLIFLNTCSVREKPEQKVYSSLGRFQLLKRSNPRLIIGIGGCMAQQEGERFLKNIPSLDFVLGTKEIGRINELLDGLEKGKRGSATDLGERVDPYASLPFHPSPGKVSAFVSIMQGCNNFCSYCIVPYVRGAEVSRPSPEILKEVQALAEGGVKEVVLLGQNVNSYGNKQSGEIGFMRLIEAVQEIGGISRIRFTTSHPKDLSPELMKAFGAFPKLCEHIHLPLQSGSNRILKAMNRGYTREEYLEKAAQLRRICPDISITTDLIVGFPGEEEEDFQSTLKIMEEAQFDDLFSFRYSDRPFIAAAAFPGKVGEATSRKRLLDLQDLQRTITRKRNNAWVGQEVEVLVEGRSKGNPAESTGRTRTNRIVNFPGMHPEGALIRLTITKAFPHSLRGEQKESQNSKINSGKME